MPRKTSRLYNNDKGFSCSPFATYMRAVSQLVLAVRFEVVWDIHFVEGITEVMALIVLERYSINRSDCDMGIDRGHWSLGSQRTPLLYALYTLLKETYLRTYVQRPPLKRRCGIGSRSNGDEVKHFGFYFDFLEKQHLCVTFVLVKIVLIYI